MQLITTYRRVAIESDGTVTVDGVPADLRQEVDENLAWLSEIARNARQLRAETVAHRLEKNRQEFSRRLNLTLIDLQHGGHTEVEAHAVVRPLRERLDAHCLDLAIRHDIALSWRSDRFFGCEGPRTGLPKDRRR